MKPVALLHVMFLLDWNNILVAQNRFGNVWIVRLLQSVWKERVVVLTRLVLNFWWWVYRLLKCEVCWAFINSLRLILFIFQLELGVSYLLLSHYLIAFAWLHDIIEGRKHELITLRLKWHICGVDLNHYRIVCPVSFSSIVLVF